MNAWEHMAKMIGDKAKENGVSFDEQLQKISRDRKIMWHKMKIKVYQKIVDNERIELSKLEEDIS